MLFHFLEAVILYSIIFYHLADHAIRAKATDYRMSSSLDVGSGVLDQDANMRNAETMADNSRWFKLWCSAPSDDDIQALPPAIRWAWAAFGCYTKQHGSSGKVIVRESNSSLAAEMGVPQNDMISVLKMFPHMDIKSVENSHGTFSVTWYNWRKYQEDSTAAKRQESRRKKRREEKRGEEKRINNNEDIIIPPKRKTKTVFPQQFLITDEMREWCRNQRITDPDDHVDAFRDYHIAKGSRFTDWQAAFRTWIRNSIRFNSGLQGQKNKAPDLYAIPSRPIEELLAEAQARRKAGKL